MSILVALRADIATRIKSSPTKTFLWLDLSREWERLLEQVSGEVELLKYEGSQLQMRAILERSPATKPRILYVPLTRTLLTVLKEYEFTLPVWDEGLVHALRKWGVEIDREEEKALAPLLPSLAARWSDKPLDYWRYLTASGVRARLFDEEQVREFLANPPGVAAELEKEGALAVFRDFLAETYGLSAAVTNPDDVARRLVQSFILSEAFPHSGSAGFPYADLLPVESARERGLSFLDRWLEARSQNQVVARVLREAERDLDLGTWVATLSPIPDVQASLTVERQLVEKVTEDLRTSASVDERSAYLAEGLSVFRRHSAHFWALEGEVPEWDALALAGTVAVAAREALAELPSLRAASELVEAYTSRWWKVDQAYRRYRAGFEGHLGLEIVAATIRWLHRRYLEETNKRFSEALESQGGLPATGLPEERSFWPESSTGRQAVLVLDAFRFELARELEDKLRRAAGQLVVELSARRAPLPSITPLGMASLLPVDGLNVEVSDGDWHIRSKGAEPGGPDLATKDGREKLLATLVPGYASLDLGKLLDLPAAQIPKATWLFVYSSTLDEVGHSGVLSLTPRTAEDYVEQCVRAVRKLGGSGFEGVHVVTDHGFFMLDDLGEHDLIPIRERRLEYGIEYKGHRAVVGRKFASTTLLCFPLVGSDLVVGVPRATGILEARGSYQFFHGGASLQEVVVPYLCTTFPRRSTKFDARLRAPSRVTSLLVDVEIDAIPPGGQASFGGQVSARFVEVRAHLVRDGQIVSPALATASGSDYFVSEEQRQRIVRLRIPPNARFAYGDTVRIVVADADAPGVILDQTDATLNVEPDV